MPDPSLSLYGGVPGYLVLWLLAAVSIALFAWRAAHLVAILRRARPEARLDRVGARLRLFAAQVLGQRRLFDEPAIGAAHFLIFWAFVVYATGFWWSLARGLAPFLPVPYADDVPPMGLALEVTGVLALAGLAVAAYRRYVIRPDRLEQSPDAARILGLIALLLASSLAGAGFRAVASPDPSAWTPVGRAIGGALAGLGVGVDGGRAGYVAMWWTHMATVLVFLAYLPYSKHLHLLASPFGVFFGTLEPGSLPAGSGGAATLAEFSWRELMSGLSCAECGRCDRACPAVATGSALSPKQLVHRVKELATGAIPPLSAAVPAAVREAVARIGRPRPVPELGPTMADGGVPVDGGNGHGGTFVGDVVTREELWGCTTCLACSRECPVLNEHLPLVVQMRRHLVSEGDVDPHVQEALTNLTRYGNSFGKSPRARTKWTDGLGFAVKDVRKTPAEYLWFVGDYASYDARLQEVTRATARVLRYAGIDFGTLAEGEQNAGTDVRRVGEEGLFEVLRDKNLAALAKGSFAKIITTDPHTYHALKHDYPLTAGGLGPVPVLHVSELLAELIERGRLPVRRVVVSPVTYHDPCYLGRYNGVYDAPRRLLRALGLILLEMPRHGAESFCCGAGGGRIWMEDAPATKERPAEARVREAGALPGVHLLAVACPKDLVMFQDALKTTGLEKRLRAVDLVELVAQAALPAGPLVDWH